MDKKFVLSDEKFQMICASHGLNYLNSATCKNAIFIYHRATNSWLIMNKDYEIVGNDIEIINNIKFQEFQLSHGMNFYLYDKFIVLETPVKGLYFLLDRNFNCFDAIRSNDEGELEHVAAMRYLVYTTRFEDGHDYVFSPFKDCSAEIILNLASRVEKVHIDPILSSEESQLFFSINKTNYQISANNVRGMMLCFLKYLGESAKNYFKSIYPLLATGVIDSTPSLSKYLNKIANEVYTETIAKKDESCIVQARSIIYKLGQMAQYDKLRVFVEQACRLISFVSFDIHDLTSLVNSCLALLSLPDDEFRRKQRVHYKVDDESEFEHLFINVENKPIRFYRHN